MAINRDKVKRTINQFQKSAPREKIDYTKYFWKPGPGKYVVRIVPSAYQEDGDSFIEKYFHYGLGVKFPVLAIGAEDPVIDAANQLKKSNLEFERKLGYQLAPKLRVFIPVIVRGEEALGVRYFQFGKSLYESLLTYAEAEEDWGDFTDVKSGHDFTVTVAVATMGQGGGTYNESTFMIKPRPVALSDDKAQVEEWLSNQPNLDDLYKPLEPEELQKMLDNVLKNLVDAAPEDQGNAPAALEPEKPNAKPTFAEEKAAKNSPTGKKPAYVNLFDE